MEPRLIAGVWVTGCADQEQIHEKNDADDCCSPYRFGRR